MQKLEKDSKYSFVVNKELKEKFKRYCRTMNISPSDILTEVMINFNNDVDKIVEMKNVDELQEMIRGKFNQVEKEIDFIKVKKN